MIYLTSRLRALMRSVISVVSALTVICGASGYASAMKVLTHEEARQITYTWTDGDGNVHTSDITERADNYNQIVALLETIYSSKDVPGTHYVPDGERTTTVSYKPVKFGSDYVDGNPSEEGLTVLLVKGKDGATNGDCRSIEYVQLITSHIRISRDEAHPDAIEGYMFNLADRIDNFFFISKGKPRNINGSFSIGTPGPFEEYSSDTSGYGHAENSYIRLLRGEQYPILHDCGVMLGSDHKFYMEDYRQSNPKSVNICLFIPDNRMTPWSKRDNNGKYTWYNPDYSPYIMSYAIELSAKEVVREYDVDKGKWMARIDLEWKGNFAEITKYPIEGEYNLFELQADGVIPDEPFAGNLHQKTYSFHVELTDEPRNITFAVKGRPVEGDFTPVTSNTVAVTVPAVNSGDFVLIDVTGTSNYDYSRQENEYVNTVTLCDRPDDKITVDRLFPGAEFAVYRYPDGADRTVAEKVGGLRVTTYGYDEAENTFNIDYDLFNTVDGADNIQTSGRFNVEVVTDDTPNPALDLSGGEIAWRDSFKASTRLNDHPGAYLYFIEFTPVTDLAGTRGKTISSVDDRVIVWKTEHDIHSTISHSLEDIEADTDGSLDSGMQIAETVALQNAPDVRLYTVWRGDPSSSGMKLAEFIHNPDGGFECQIRNHDGQMVEGEIPANNTGRFEMVEFVDWFSGTSSRYVVVITAVDGSTYGCDIQEYGVASVALNVRDLLTTLRYENEIWYADFCSHLDWVPAYDSGQFRPMFYRLWRTPDSKPVEIFVGRHNVGTDTDTEPDDSGASALSADDGEALLQNVEEMGDRLMFTDSFYILYDTMRRFPTDYRLRLYSAKLDSDGNPVGRYMISESRGSAVTDIPTAADAPSADDDFKGDVYNLQGIKVLSGATGEEIRALPAGLYIIGGEKVVIR